MGTGTVAKTGLLCYAQSATLNVWNPIYRSTTLPFTTTTTTGDFVSLGSNNPGSRTGLTLRRFAGRRCFLTLTLTSSRDHHVDDVHPTYSAFALETYRCAAACSSFFRRLVPHSFACASILARPPGHSS